MALQKQQWEAEMALKNKQLAISRAKRGGSGEIVKNDLGGGGNDGGFKEMSEYATNYSNRLKYLQTLNGTTNESLEKSLYKEVQSGKITEQEAEYICLKLGI